MEKLEDQNGSYQVIARVEARYMPIKLSTVDIHLDAKSLKEEKEELFEIVAETIYLRGLLKEAELSACHQLVRINSEMKYRKWKKENGKRKRSSNPRKNKQPNPILGESRKRSKSS